jgi:GTPase SAR1 family protein
MRTALFVVGAPGVGKTALVRELIGFPETYTIAKPKWTVSNDGLVCAAGHYLGETFDGADMVPYNGAAVALEHWKRHITSQLSIFDGDRFSNGNSLAYVRSVVDKVLCLHMTAPADVLAARRVERGSNQNETWLKGRVTKAANFASTFDTAHLMVLTALQSPSELADVVKHFVGAAV